MIGHVLSDPWTLDPGVVIGVVLAVLLYWRGTNVMRRLSGPQAVPEWRTLLFGAGLFAVFVALESPVDRLADTYFSMHMVQHDILIFLAAPFVVLAQPLWPLWRGIPVSWRRVGLGYVVRQPTLHRLQHGVTKVLMTPWLAWIVFAADFTAWHIPALYDLALRNQGIHDTEHLSFLLTAVWFWAQVIPSAPFRPAWGYLGRAIYLFAAAMQLHMMALIYENSVSSFYPHYAQHARELGGMAAVVQDQTFAGAIMDAPAFLYALGILILLTLWLKADLEEDTAAVQAPAQATAQATAQAATAKTAKVTTPATPARLATSANPATVAKPTPTRAVHDPAQAEPVR